MALLGAMMLGACATSKLPAYDVRPENRPPGKMTRAGRLIMTYSYTRRFMRLRILTPCIVLKGRGFRDVVDIMNYIVPRRQLI